MPPRTYQGISYGFEMRIRRRGGRIATKKVQVIYEKDTHQQLLSEMGRVLREFGCSLDGVDLEEFLMHITGFTRVDRPIILNGRGLPPLDDERPPGYDYKVNWMLEDRNLIDALVRLVFSRLDLVARNSTIIQPTPILNGAASMAGSRTYRKAAHLAPSPNRSRSLAPSPQSHDRARPGGGPCPGRTRARGRRVLRSLAAGRRRSKIKAEGLEPRRSEIKALSYIGACQNRAYTQRFS